MKSLLFLFLITITTLSSFAQSSEAFYYNVDTLCSPYFKGRGAGLSGDSLASEYLARQFEKIGIAAIDSNYFQEFVYPVNVFEGETYLKLGKEVLRPGVDFIPGGKSAAGKGKLKVLRYPDQIGDMKEGKKYAVVLDFDKSPLDAQVKKQVAVFIHDAKGKLVMPVAGKPEDVVMFEVKSNKIPEKLKKVKYELDARYIENHRARNVIGVVPGLSDSIMVVSAHYDHVGTLGASAYFPGANDNASGVAMLLELAKYYCGNPPKYTMVFICFAGEEAGLKGSYNYTLAPNIDLEKVRMVLNLDLMGSGSEGVTVVNGYEQKRFMEVINQVNDSLSIVPSVKTRGQAPNSDHYYFSKKDVPAVFVYARGRVGGYHDVYDIPQELEINGFDALFKLFVETLAQF